MNSLIKALKNRMNETGELHLDEKSTKYLLSWVEQNERAIEGERKYFANAMKTINDLLDKERGKQ